jgi:lactate dehydrogenase-like 2-hydroxyacid dehydrogenase
MVAAVEEAVGERIRWANARGPVARGRAGLVLRGASAGKDARPSALEWIHTGWAGVEGWMRRPEWSDDVVLTRTVGDFPERMSQYVFGYLLAQELGVARAIREMQTRAWKRWTPGSIAAWRLLVVGHGAIGARIAEVGRAFGMSVSGVRRGSVKRRREEERGPLGGGSGPTPADRGRDRERVAAHPRDAVLLGPGPVRAHA